MQSSSQSQTGEGVALAPLNLQMDLTSTLSPPTPVSILSSVPQKKLKMLESRLAPATPTVDAKDAAKDGAKPIPGSSAAVPMEVEVLPPSPEAKVPSPRVSQRRNMDRLEDIEGFSDVESEMPVVEVRDARGSCVCSAPAPCRGLGIRKGESLCWWC